jgi:hypothetical protein
VRVCGEGDGGAVSQAGTEAEEVGKLWIEARSGVVVDKGGVQLALPRDRSCAPCRQTRRRRLGLRTRGLLSRTRLLWEV